MNKAAIRSQFKALLNRNDCSNTLADTFIDQAVGRISRTLRIPSMERGATIVFTELQPDWFSLPKDFLEFIDLYTEDCNGGHKLEMLPRGRFLMIPPGAGQPRAYLRTGASVQVKPQPALGSTLYMVYHSELTDLNTDTDENEITRIAPELLIYAALSNAADYFVDERKDAFEGVYIRTYQELTEQAEALEFSGGAMAVQSAYPHY